MYRSLNVEGKMVVRDGARVWLPVETVRCPGRRSHPQKISFRGVHVEDGHVFHPVETQREEQGVGVEASTPKDPWVMEGITGFRPMK